VTAVDNGQVPLGARPRQIEDVYVVGGARSARRHKALTSRGLEGRTESGTPWCRTARIRKRDVRPVYGRTRYYIS
jgi:hypothetical protein